MSRSFNRHSNNDILDAEHINELQEALEEDDIRIDGKADSTHQHSISDITFNGNFRINDSNPDVTQIGFPEGGSEVLITDGMVNIRSGSGGPVLSVDSSGISSTVAPTLDINLTRKDYVDNLVATKADKAVALGVVNHGSNANTPRPAGYSIVRWIGSVEPANAEEYDEWIDIS